MQSLWESYYKDCHAILYVVDGTDPSRFKHSKELLHKLCKDPKVSNIPIILLINKCDDKKVVSKAQVFNQFELDKCGKEVNIHSVSAFTGFV